MPAWGEDEGKEEGKNSQETKNTTRRPRRALDDDDEVKNPSVAATNSSEEKPSANAGRQGWGSPSRAESKKTEASSSERETVEAADDDDEPAGRRQNLRDMEDPVEMLIIPDLDEEEVEDITTQVAVAPKNMARRVQSLQQLDREIKFTVPSASGVDLSLLTSSLVPPRMVEEDDRVWTFDALLQEVTQEFNEEKERRAEDVKEGLIKDKPKTQQESEIKIELGTKKRGMTQMFA